MDEKTETKETTDTPKEDAGAGNKPQTTPLIDIANAAAKRMEDANAETARLQEVQAERDQRIALGGRSNAGGEAVKPKEDTPKEYVDKVMRGEIGDGN